MKTRKLIWALILGFIMVIVLTSCNPCKYVAKHQECFPADTLKTTNTVVKFEKVYTTQDSIVHDTIPCDPDNLEVDVKTIYKTIYKTKTDTVTNTVYNSKVNPVNTKLQSEIEKLNKQAEKDNSKINKLKKRSFNRMIAIYVLSLSLLAFLLLTYYIKK